MGHSMKQEVIHALESSGLTVMRTADWQATLAELARLRILEQAVKNFAQVDVAARELLRGCEQETT